MIVFNSNFPEHLRVILNTQLLSAEPLDVRLMTQEEEIAHPKEILEDIKIRREVERSQQKNKNVLDSSPSPPT
jgi:hypothetical protein